jgi:hypothetical protein
MRRPNLILGLLLLGVAAAVGFYTSQPAGNPGPTTVSAASKSDTPYRAADPDVRNSRGERTPREPLSIDVPENESPELTIRARRLDSDSHRRLDALTERLNLTPGQQRRVYPLLARSNPEYDDALRIRGGIIIGPPGRISKAAADEYITALLDPDQLLEQKIAEAKDDIWWTHVIAKLEKDLIDGTNPATDAAAPPEPPEQAAPASDEPRSAPRSHRGGNLFDRMENQDP